MSFLLPTYTWRQVDTFPDLDEMKYNLMYFANTCHETFPVSYDPSQTGSMVLPGQPNQAFRPYVPPTHMSASRKDCAHQNRYCILKLTTFQNRIILPSPFFKMMIRFDIADAINGVFVNRRNVDVYGWRFTCRSAFVYSSEIKTNFVFDDAWRGDLCTKIIGFLSSPILRKLPNTGQIIETYYRRNLVDRKSFIKFKPTTFGASPKKRFNLYRPKYEDRSQAYHISSSNKWISLKSQPHYLLFTPKFFSAIKLETLRTLNKNKFLICKCLSVIIDMENHFKLNLNYVTTGEPDSHPNDGIK
ncbi:hypothetical protein RF11_01950 [Thelohanellus kitauei]|uniref:Uncharacterized protein n=1 Tax=Thelohanellus kitauei TaxID=669202 RepID=A0A0C2IR84_THEKT|nr:hypothetical protein RF11_01950 [Thelohanellus kitauei]